MWIKREGFSFYRMRDGGIMLDWLSPEKRKELNEMSPERFNEIFRE